MNNADLARIINSDEVQSVLNPAKIAAKKALVEGQSSEIAQKSESIDSLSQKVSTPISRIKLIIYVSV